MPTITLFDKHREAQLTIERLYYALSDLSQEMAVSVVQDSFQGTGRAWFEYTAFKNFVAQLRKCEELRRGEASLNAMSPQEFSLRISNTHPKGDFALTYQISHYQHRIHLKGEFDLDPSLLLQILRDFENFLLLPE